MRAILLAVVVSTIVLAQDARDILRKSVELDQGNWARMKNYTWTAHESERHLDFNGRVKSEDSKTWETVVLYGQPHRKIVDRNGQPLSAVEQRKEQAKLDEALVKLQHEDPVQRERRQAKQEKAREKEREFLREIPDMYDLRLEGEQKIDGHDVWVIAATPKTGYQPKHSDAKPLLKIRGKLWIDKAEYQWVRLEAETIDTISYGLFIARLNPGAKLVFEQARVNDEIWLPKREYVRGFGRVGLLKKVALESELTWSNFRKFQVDSKIVATQ